MYEPFSFYDHLIGPGLLLVLFLVVRRAGISGDRRRAALREQAIAAGELPPAEPRTTPWLRGLVGSVVLATVYLLGFRAISNLPPIYTEQKGGAFLMSFSFLFLGPFLAGVLTVAQGTSKEPWTIAECIVNAWIPIAINLAIALAVAWEGIICAVFIVPPSMIGAALGGLVAGAIQRHLHRRAARQTMLCLAVVPFLLALAETKLDQPLETRNVRSSITIHAPTAAIWSNIERVRAIEPSELRPSWANMIGFPRPIEATLSLEGVGGVRNASFERGLSFTETITDWEPGHRIGFTIRADTDRIPATTLDEHVTVGGRFFDVLTGEYALEPLPNGDTVLHLTSRERLSTDFNFYAALWSDAVMSDMQANILHVIRNRCEAETSH